MKQLTHIIIALNLVFLGSIKAQTDEEIHQILKAKDSLLFERSFNKCETQYLEQLISEDFEFYHDKSGITDSKAAFIEVMQNGICNPNNQTKSRRELVGKLKTFPLKKNGAVYGALQNGVHKFFETTNGKEIVGSIAKFSHLWILNNSNWEIKRVISFDHKHQEKPMNKAFSINPKILDQYVGLYKGSNTGEVKITKTKNGLYIDTQSFKTDIIAKTETIFFHQQMPLTFEFIKGNSGNISKFIVRENDKIVEEVIKQ